mmetsp:Transcript_26303/g.105276  ORF Transcript_26303/g.105276 Transcript_26303/m.105276 type:complete len:337 (-) Transcript_26303:242-1252(-)
MLGERAERARDLERRLRVEPRRDLVPRDEAALAHEHLADRHAAPLPAADAANRRVTDDRLADVVDAQNAHDRLQLALRRRREQSLDVRDLVVVRAVDVLQLRHGRRLRLARRTLQRRRLRRLRRVLASFLGGGFLEQLGLALGRAQRVARRVRAEGEVERVAHGERRDVLVDLVDVDAQLGRHEGPVLGVDVLAVERALLVRQRGRRRLLAEQAAQQFEERRLAAAGGADNERHRPLLEDARHRLEDRPFGLQRAPLALRSDGLRDAIERRAERVRVAHRLDLGLGQIDRRRVVDVAVAYFDFGQVEVLLLKRPDRFDELLDVALALARDERVVAI